MRSVLTARESAREEFHVYLVNHKATISFNSVLKITVCNRSKHNVLSARTAWCPAYKYWFKLHQYTDTPTALNG